MEKMRLVLPLPTELVDIVLEFSDLPFNTHEKKMKLNKRFNSLVYKFRENMYHPSLYRNFPTLYFLRWLRNRGFIKGKHLNPPWLECMFWRR